MAVEESVTAMNNADYICESLNYIMLWIMTAILKTLNQLIGC